MKESSATIKLTQSEITHTIMALVMARRASEVLGNEYYQKMFDSLWKDFETIKNAIIEGEKEIETRNKTEEEDRSGPKTCEICID